MGDKTLNADLERWLRDEVAPTYDAMQSNPERGIPAEEVLAAVRAHHTNKVAAADDPESDKLL